MPRLRRTPSPLAARAGRAGAARWARRPALRLGPGRPSGACTSEAIDTLPKGAQAVLQDPPAGDARRSSLEATLAEDGPGAPLRGRPPAAVPLRRPAAHARRRSRRGSPRTRGKVGRLPWLIQESYARLVEAFRSGDKARSWPSPTPWPGCVADLHNPLALTDNADGQKTGQHGLWVRFSDQAAGGDGQAS